MKRISELELGLDQDSTNPAELLHAAVEIMVDRDHRKLENWILVNFCMSFNREGRERFEWVECGEAPDYRIFTRPDSEPQPIEVTEVLDPGRKRQKEYVEALNEAERTGDYLVTKDLHEAPADYEAKLVDQARRLLKRKFAKPYPPDTWLVVYFNPVLPAAGEDSHSFGIRVLRIALDQVGRPERISQIWILTNTLRIARVL
jgi:hypothetical protein